MRSVSVRLDDLRTMILNIGFVGENEHKRFIFDCKKMFDQYPNAAASMTVQPPEGEAYPAIIERDGDYVIWDVTDSDLAHDGDGELQLAFTQEPHVAKSYIGRTRVCPALVPSGDIPEGIDDFLTRAGAALTAIPETIDDALAAAKASGEFDGADGQDGQDGADGFSPTVAVTEITGGHQVAVTDAEGTTTFDVMDGVDGQDGSDGAPGADGFSPRATVSKSGKVATITITDAAGTTTATVSDGEDGQGTNIIDDTAGAGDTDKTFSADKLTADHSSLLNQIDSLDNSKAPVIINSASGAIATFSDGADDLPVESMTVQIEPVQDLNGQSSPYPAGGGKNLVDWVGPQTITTQTVIVRYDTSEQATFTASVTAVNNASINGALNLYAYNDNTLVKSKQTVILANATSARYAVTLDLSDTTYNNIRISISGASSGYSLTISDAQLEKGSTATSFAPYSNICPISGWTGANVYRTGKNLIYPKYSGRTNNGITYTVNSDGTITTSGTATASSYAAENLSSQPDKMSLLPAGTYSLTGGISANEIVYLGGKYTDGTSLPTTYDRGSGATFTLTKPAYVYPQIQVVNGTSSNRTFTIQLELGSTATAYEPYQGSTYPITWDEAGTVYGGTVNPVTGKLIVDRASVDLGTLNWSYDSQYQRFFTVGLTSVIKKGSSGWILPICSAYKSAVGVSDDKTISEYATTGYVYIKDTSYTDAAVFKTALSGVKLVYELVATVEYDLTHIEIRTLLGTNNIWADTGDVAVDYRADTRLYVERMSASGGITVDTALSASSTNPVQNKVINTALAAKEPKHNTVSVSGTTPTISGVDGTRYICGEVSTMTITAPASGCIDVTFTSGSTPTVLTVNSAKANTTVKWANGFDPTSLDANTTYEVNILDGEWGVVGAWT